MSLFYYRMLQQVFKVMLRENKKKIVYTEWTLILLTGHQLRNLYDNNQLKHYKTIYKPQQLLRSSLDIVDQ